MEPPWPGHTGYLRIFHFIFKRHGHHGHGHGHGHGHCHPHHIVIPHHIWPGRAAEWGGRWKIWDSWLSGLFGMQCTKLNIRYYENISSCKILCHFTILTTPKISYGINEISFALCHKLLVKCLKSWSAINATKHLNPDVGSWGLMYISRWELWKRVNLWSSKLTRRTLEHIRLWIYTSTYYTSMHFYGMYDDRICCKIVVIGKSYHNELCFQCTDYIDIDIA